MVSIIRSKTIITPHITIPFILQSGYTVHPTPPHQPISERKGNQSISTDGGIFTVLSADPVQAAVVAAVRAVSVVAVPAVPFAGGRQHGHLNGR